MDFIAKSNRQGFFGKDQNQNQNQSQSQNQNQNHNQFMIRGKLPFSSSSSTSSSSSSSSQPHKSLVPLTFHHHHHQQQQRGSWLENKFQPQQPSAAEEISSFRIYAGGPANLELMDTSPTTGNNGDGDADAADDDNDIRRGDSSFDGLGLGVGGGGGASGSTKVGLVVEREHMFDKVVTPSDVGKLNRLVIPKQHAEKYFPLDSSTNEKGLLLNFEDRNGKPWRFRYSYWNSSQSYVMTKGWSRFVKEKKLDAGDIVSFQRGVGELGKACLFIDWRRRPDAPELPPSLPTLSHHLLLPQQQYFSSFHRSTTHPWSPHFLQPQAAALRDHSQHFSHLNAVNYQPHLSSYGYSGGSSGGPYSYNSVVNPCSSSVIYLRSAAAVAPLEAGMVQVQSGVGGGGGVEPPMVFESVPVVHGKAAAKRLRLFGVNMDCPISELDECELLSSTTTTTTTTITPHAATIAPPHLSSTPIPPLQLRLFNSSPLPAMHSDLLHKANASNKSFGFDI